MKTSFALGSLLVLGSCYPLWCQTPGGNRPGSQDGTGQRPPARRQGPPAVRTVEIAPDRHVTFRLYAPRASDVRVDCQGRHPMVKDEAGVWSVTIGPLEPEIYSYSLMVDETVHVPDPQNPDKKSPGEDLLEIPSHPPAVWQQQDVPHGTVHINWYPSRTLGITRRAHVYTPPGYEEHPRWRYPVLYLLHGSGDDDSNWISTGRANWILDNLIAEHKAPPMVVIMPQGHVPPLARETDRRNQMARFEKDLLQDLMPYVNVNYRVKEDPAHQAIAGLSMGAMQSQGIGLTHPELFGWVGLMSGAGIGRASLDSTLPGLIANPARTNQQFRLIYISVGTSDGLRPLSQKFESWLTSHGIHSVYHETEGAHEWKVWRHSLAEFVPMLFTRS